MRELRAVAKFMWAQKPLLQTGARSERDLSRKYVALLHAGGGQQYLAFVREGRNPGNGNWKELLRVEAKIQFALFEGGNHRLETAWDWATGSEGAEYCPSPACPPALCLCNGAAAAEPAHCEVLQGKVREGLCLNPDTALKAVFAHQKLSKR